jgi:vancomycin permeability regulator SanA
MRAMHSPDMPPASASTRPEDQTVSEAGADAATSGSTPRRRHTLRWVVAASLAVLLLVVFAPIVWVQVAGQAQLRADAIDVPHRSVALVFGAGLRPDGTPSTYLTRRLDMARALFDAGTVDVILVSGDNSSLNYDEPTAMVTWLTEAGVPADRIVADYAGFDTHDTCVRAKKVFGVEDAVLVTQDYHVRRALFSCSTAGIDAVGVGVSSENVSSAKKLSYQARELAASWKAGLDGLTRRSPTYLGDVETGVQDALAGPRADQDRD